MNRLSTLPLALVFVLAGASPSTAWAFEPPQTDASEPEDAVAAPPGGDASADETSPSGDAEGPEGDAESSEDADGAGAADPGGDEGDAAGDGGDVVPDEADEPDTPAEKFELPPPPPPAPLPHKHRLYYLNLTAARLNPIGLVNGFTMDYQYRLYDEPSLLKNGSYLGLGVQPIVSPALARVSALLTVQPLAILRLRASIGVLAHFGTFDHLQSFDSPRDEYDSFLLDTNTEAGESSVGYQAELGALLQAKVGPVAVRNEVKFLHTNTPLGDQDGDGRPDDVFYYVQDDIMIAGTGWHFTNDTDLLYLTKFGLTAGVRATYVRAFYPDSAYEPGERRGGVPNDTFRVGPLLAYTIYDKPQKKPRFNKPSILLISQWFARHNYRTAGVPKDEVIDVWDGARGAPYFILGFSFEGEFWGTDGKNAKK